MRWASDRLAQVGEFVVPLSHAPGDEWRTQASVFEEIYFIFLALGTAVGIVVIGYMLYNGWKYSASKGTTELDDPPVLGELPRGEGGGKKLFLSFGISAVIVITLIVWSYSALIYAEQGPEEFEDNMVVEVEGYTFGWDFIYENGETSTNTLVVPEDHVVTLEVTSRDVWHTFGVTELRIKADSIPGQTATTWFIADEQGIYLAECFELCGAGHSFMEADVIVVSEETFEEMYDEFTETGSFPDPPDDLEER